VGQPIRQMGEQAADLLLAMVEGTARPMPEQNEEAPRVLMAAQLVVRHSTAPPPGGV
jgi:DNA-binding LacI/PurR family transcriptional regulator